MTSRRRRSRVPLDGPPPLFRRLGEQVRKAITPPPPPRPWQEVVPDPHLRRYFTAIWDADAIRVWDMPIYLSGLRMLVGEEDEHTRAHRIGEYWRFGPLRTLSLKLIYHSEDPSRGIVLAPARVRGRLIRNISAAVVPTGVYGRACPGRRGPRTDLGLAGDTRCRVGTRLRRERGDPPASVRRRSSGAVARRFGPADAPLGRGMDAATQAPSISQGAGGDRGSPWRRAVARPARSLHPLGLGTSSAGGACGSPGLRTRSGTLGVADRRG
jgi:hypothetical protein